MTVIPYTQQLFRGLSTDEKPSPENGDVFTETDTGIVWVAKYGIWTEVIAGADIKAGSVFVPKDSTVEVPFITPFDKVPDVIVSLASNSKVKVLYVSNVTANSFSVTVEDEDATVSWIAISNGNI